MRVAERPVNRPAAFEGRAFAMVNLADFVVAIVMFFLFLTAPYIAKLLFSMLRGYKAPWTDYVRSNLEYPTALALRITFCYLAVAFFPWSDLELEFLEPPLFAIIRFVGWCAIFYSSMKVLKVCVELFSLYLAHRRISPGFRAGAVEKEICPASNFPTFTAQVGRDGDPCPPYPSA